MTEPLVSVIIPTLNEGENLRALLPALAEQDFPHEVEIIVIDSGSTDDTLEVCKQHGVQTLTIPKGTFNHGGTRLKAAKTARGEILVFTVGDALPADKNWLQTLVGAAIEDENVAGCYGIQVGPEDPAINPLEQEVSLEEQIALGVCNTPHGTRDETSGRITKKVAAGQTFAELDPMIRRTLASFDNCNSCARRRILLEEIPFDSVTFGEDYQWAAKCLARGYSIAFEPRAKVFHYHVQNFRYFFKRMWLDQKIVEDVFELRGHRSVSDLLGSWRREVGSSWGSLKQKVGLTRSGRMKWFIYNLKLITANRLARYLTEAEGRSHPLGWIADGVERRLGREVTIRRPD